MTDDSATTPWRRRVGTPLRQFLGTEAGSAVVLVTAIAAALIWANVADGNYEHFWATDLSIDLGDDGIHLTLREWVNSGLMTLFFLVVGLEARREFDLGDLRDLSLIHISEPTRLRRISYAVFCLKKKKS